MSFAFLPVGNVNESRFQPSVELVKGTVYRSPSWASQTTTPLSPAAG